MVYMIGSDLESEDGFATDDLEEMMAAQGSDHLNVVIETGGANKWQNTYVSAEKNQRWIIKNGQMELVDNSLGNMNMGEPDTLSSFINWTVENYPADNYILSLWDHGGGAVSGFGIDEKHDDDSLTLAEIEKAFNDSIGKNNLEFEMINFDSCLMASLETAYISRNFARYLVGSEEMEPDHGWYYTPVLSAISKNDAISGAELGKVIMDAFKEQSVEEETDDEITLSVIDLGKIDPVIESLDKFISRAELNIQNESGLRIMSLARSRAESYGDADEESDSADMVDLSDLALNVQAEYSGLAEDLAARISDAVIYNLTSRIKPDARGLSIYLPYDDKENFDENLKIYGGIDFLQSYIKFVKEYAAKIIQTGASVDFTDSSPEPSQGDDYKVTIDPEYLDNVSNIFYMIGTTDGEYDTVLGEDTGVQFDKKTGEVTSRFDGKWFTMEGKQISMFFEKDYGDFKLYSIPAILNGNDVDMLVTIDKNYKCEILGATSNLDQGGNISAKKTTKIKKGDTITPLLYYYSLDTDEEGYDEGDTFTVDNMPEIIYGELPDGLYFYGYIVEDFAGNEVFSDFVEVDVSS
jgi:hypothetical protein